MAKEIYMRVVSRSYQSGPRMHTFRCQIVEQDGNNITESPASDHSIHRKVIDEQYGGSWKTWLTEVVKEELMDHWHASHDEEHIAELSSLMKEKL
jgi:hypothetical protein